MTFPRRRVHGPSGLSEGPGSGPLKTLLTPWEVAFQSWITALRNEVGNSTVVGGNVCIPKKLASGPNGQVVRD